MKLFIFLSGIFFYSCTNSNQSAIIYPEGGYNLPIKVDDKDTTFFCYPIKGIESKRDSFNDAFYGYKLLHAFDEPNLSIKPALKPVFRFIYEPWTEVAYIITLYEENIVVKKGNRVDYLNKDETKLTELEKIHFDLFEWNYPIIQGNKKVHVQKQHRLDSLLKLYPKLADETYYTYLLNKVFIPLETPFTYTTKQLPISKSEYKKLVDLINSSGYWKLPFELPCKDRPTDGFVFTLEANTGQKYNIVRAGSCGDSATNFAKACQTLLGYATVDDEIKVAHTN